MVEREGHKAVMTIEELAAAMKWPQIDDASDDLFKYTPLPQGRPDSFRLLRLFPPRIGGNVECELY